MLYDLIKVDGMMITIDGGNGFEYSVMLDKNYNQYVYWDKKEGFYRTKLPMINSDSLLVYKRLKGKKEEIIRILTGE